jgi:hypothetical protein
MTAGHIVFLGNSNANFICEIYRRILPPDRRGEATHVPAFTAADAEASGALANADHVMWQRTDLGQEISKIQTRGQIHLFPSVICPFLWPYGGHPHPMNRSYPFLEIGPYPMTSGDAFLNQMIAAGIEAEQAAAQYVDTDVARVRGARRMYEIVLEKQRARDAACGSDYNVASLIESLMSVQPLFRDRAHINPPILSHIATILLGRVGLGSEAANAQCHNLVPYPETAIHPTVAAEFGMTFIQPDTRYEALYEGAFTFEESAIRYMRYEWNPGLAEAFSAFQKQDSIGALTLLRQSLPLSPRSHRGQGLLEHLERSSDNPRTVSA